MQKRNIKKLFSLVLCMVLLLPMNVREVIHANASGTIHYNVSEGNVVISSDGDYSITGETGTYTIEIEAGVNANVTLDHVYVTTDSASSKSPFKIADNSTGNVVITLEGENKLICNSVDHAALQKNGDGNGIGNLTIQGTGSLTAVGGGEAAGIGGGSYGASTDNITINSGTVTATGGYWAAGIGGASGGSGGNITISGGIVKANGGNLGAGIGGGSAGAGNHITISGGMVEAVGGAEAAAGIGGGNMASGSNIIISGGVVTAKADSRDAIDDSGSQTVWSGIVYQNGAGLIYGDTLELTSNTDISADKTLTIRAGQTLTIAKNVILSVGGTLTNNGTIKEYGEIRVTGTGSVTGNVPQKKAERITLNKTKLSCLLGESVVLTAVTEPEVIFDDVTWSCNNEQIVSFKGNGKTAELKAKKAGEATITAKAGDVSVTCNVTVNKLKGTATVTVEDIYYGKTPVVQMQSTNGIKNAVVEYISLDEENAVYSEQVPKSHGKYRVKATFPETVNYTEAEATADFKIIYLPVPDPSYEMSGTKGENGFYISQVTLKPKTGYQISTKLDEDYGNSITFHASQDNAKVYLINAQGEKTAAVRVNAFKIDTEAPNVGAGNNAVFYADKVDIAVNDDNLSKIVVNGSEIKFIGTYAKVALTSDNGRKTYQIVASDLAGNAKTVNITVAAPWMKDGVIPSGMSIHLLRSQVYMLGSGKWTVSGDTTTYTGTQSFYVGSDGDYVFTQQ